MNTRTEQGVQPALTSLLADRDRQDIIFGDQFMNQSVRTSKPLTPDDPLYSRQEAAKYLDLTPITLAVWASKAATQGEPQPIPVLKQGRSVRYRKSALDAYLQRCQRE